MKAERLYQESPWRDRRWAVRSSAPVFAEPSICSASRRSSAGCSGTPTNRSGAGEAPIAFSPTSRSRPAGHVGTEVLNARVRQPVFAEGASQEVPERLQAGAFRPAEDDGDAVLVAEQQRRGRSGRLANVGVPTRGGAKTGGEVGGVACEVSDQGDAGHQGRLSIRAQMIAISGRL